MVWVGGTEVVEWKGTVLFGVGGGLVNVEDWVCGGAVLFGRGCELADVGD